MAKKRVNKYKNGDLRREEKRVVRYELTQFSIKSNDHK